MGRLAMALIGNPYANLKLQNILSLGKKSPTYKSGYINPEQEDQQDITTPNRPDDNMRFYDELLKLQSNPSPMTSEYQKMLKNVPRPEQYAPTKMDRFAAAMSGLGAGLRDPGAGYATAHEQLRTPYTTALGDYAVRLKGVGEAADLERQDLQMKLKNLSEARALGLKYDEYGLRKQQQQDLTNYRNAQLGYKGQELGLKGQELGLKQKQLGIQERGVKATEARNEATRQFNQGRLGIMALDAQTRQAVANSTSKYHDVMGAAATKRAQSYAERVSNLNQRQTKVSPVQQGRALQNSLLVMKTDPRWNKYIQPDSNNPSILTIADPDGSRIYDMFKEELARQVNQSLKSGTPFEDESDEDNDFGFEIIER
jgi:hypothetical protein